MANYQRNTCIRCKTTQVISNQQAQEPNRNAQEHAHTPNCRCDTQVPHYH
ncbi:hypothetical protein NEUTE2DRAFT_84754 [Neurospora tetrasperma FGSC 2509]|nr:hypothetical protein NEUTE2DRAFT_84754 [Neurospora tetrasperma FGSC 2509]